MSDNKTESGPLIIHDGLADIIAKHRLHDGLRGDYEVAPYRKFLTCTGCDWEHDIAGMNGWRSWVAKHAEHVAESIRSVIPDPDNHHNAVLCPYCSPGDVLLPGMVAVPKPRITTGPKHQTVDEATASYLREASQRVRSGRFWGSGVSRLVADLLGDAADAVSRTAGGAS